MVKPRLMRAGYVQYQVTHEISQSCHWNCI